MRSDLDISEKNIVALDEAGRGCLSGPVVAAAVILPKDFESTLIRDSKKMTEKQREKAYDIIKEVAIDYSVFYADAKIIDDINILQATMTAMHNCLVAIEKPFSRIIVDGNYFKTFRDYEHTCIIKGDDTYYSIAAASILAKVSRDRYMKKLHQEFPIYKWESNKGYGSKEHIKAIKDNGITEYHRKSFLKNII